MGRLDDTGLLALLYGGQGQRAPWSDFLRAVQRTARADAAALLFCHGAPNAAAATTWPTADAQRPTPGALNGLRPNRVYAFEEFTPMDANSQPFGRAIRVCDSDTWSAWFIISREFSDFTAADSVLLSMLAPHLTIAMRAFSVLERTRQSADVAHDLLSRIGVTLHLVDNEGRLMEDGCTPATKKHIERALAHLAADGGATAVRLPQADDEAPTTFLATDASNGSLVAAPAAHRVVVARTPQKLHGDLARYFEDLWSLSASEARLTVAIANGLSLVEAAEELGLTTETARNYSKRIYAKTGARGLPDLVRLTLSSVAVLG